MSTPVLSKMLVAWNTVTAAADPFLDSFTTESLRGDMPLNAKSVGQTVGSALRRVTYHYWYHIRETQAIRQVLGHVELPVYVGDI
ncbi:MAG: hypothetical protein V1755_07390 [Chloroflexota bacterium]